MNTLQKGNKGLGRAIAYFTSKGYTVSIPLNDAQDYDLIIDDGSLKKVQVKYSEHLSQNKNKNYTVSLRTIFSTTTGVVKTTTFKDGCCDLLYVLLGNDEQYIFQKNQIEQVSAITITEKLEQYKI